MLARWALGLLIVAALSGCADLAYLGQAVQGHWQVWRASRSVDAWLADPATPAATRQRLQRAQQARAFALQTLHLPDGPSYRRYAELGRSAVVWNVVATPADALSLQTWCVPVAGCVGYRGFFERAAAQALRRDLQAQGLEVWVYGVPAYSTLGWTDWLGGDPLLDTWWAMDEIDWVRLMFHELAHQAVYVPGDTAFNEAFATAVQKLGGQQWLAAQASPAQRMQAARADTQRAAFAALTARTRQELTQIYQQKSAQSHATSAWIALKNEAFARLRRDYAVLRAHAGGALPWDAWVAQANNAALAVQAAYDAQVPAFEALYRSQGGDWPRFYDAVRALARLAPAQRDAQLGALSAAAQSQQAAP